MTKWKMVPDEMSFEQEASAMNAYAESLVAVSGNPADGIIAGRDIRAAYESALSAAPKYEPTAEQVERAARVLCETSARIPDGCAAICMDRLGNIGQCQHATKVHGKRARAVLMTLEMKRLIMPTKEVTSGPGIGWEISEKTRREIEAIEEHLQWSAARAVLMTLEG